jgi:hypothetical protein
MRSREMHNKLDRLSGSVDDDEPTCPDTSLLSPEDQDWVQEIFAKISDAKDENDFRAKVSEAELRKLSDLLAELPRRSRGEGFAGPSFAIPRNLERLFQYFDLHTLKVVQKVRLVELCRKYGWEGEYPDPDRDGGWKKHRSPVRLVPLCEWDAENEAELQALLKEAGVDYSKIPVFHKADGTRLTPPLLSF